MASGEGVARWRCLFRPLRYLDTGGYKYSGSTLCWRRSSWRHCDETRRAESPTSNVTSGCRPWNAEASRRALLFSDPDHLTSELPTSCLLLCMILLFTMGFLLLWASRPPATGHLIASVYEGEPLAIIQVVCTKRHLVATHGLHTLKSPFQFTITLCMARSFIYY